MCFLLWNRKETKKEVEQKRATTNRKERKKKFNTQTRCQPTQCCWANNGEVPLGEIDLRILISGYIEKFKELESLIFLL